MLQAVQRHWAPRAARVSIRTCRQTGEGWIQQLKAGERSKEQRGAQDALRNLTAVWAVMWVQPTILAPANGFSLCALFLSETRADISEKREHGRRKRRRRKRGEREAEKQGRKKKKWDRSKKSASNAENIIQRREGWWWLTDGLSDESDGKEKPPRWDLPCSAISISRLPNSACLMFFTQKSLLPLELTWVRSRGEVSSSELSV